MSQFRIVTTSYNHCTNLPGWKTALFASNNMNVLWAPINLLLAFKAIESMIGAAAQSSAGTVVWDMDGRGRSFVPSLQVQCEIWCRQLWRARSVGNGVIKGRGGSVRSSRTFLHRVCWKCSDYRTVGLLQLLTSYETDTTRRLLQSCVKTSLLSSNLPQNVPLPTPKMHCDKIFQPAIP